MGFAVSGEHPGARVWGGDPPWWLCSLSLKQPCFVQCGIDNRLRLIGNRRKWQPRLGPTKAEAGCCIFYRAWAGFDEKRLMQRHQVFMKRKRFVIVACETGALEIRAKPWRHVRRNGNAPMSSMGHESERRCVFARELVELFAKRQALLANAHGRRRCVLHACDVRKLKEPSHRRDRHVDDATGGNVVDQDRNAYRIVDGLEVLIKPFLRRLVIIRRDDQHRACPRFPSVASQRNGFLRAIRAGPGDNRNPAFRRRDARLDHLLMLVVAKRRRFARRPNWNKSVRPGLNLKLHKTGKGIIIHSIAVERRDQRCKRPLEHSVVSSPSEKRLGTGYVMLTSLSLLLNRRRHRQACHSVAGYGGDA